MQLSGKRWADSFSLSIPQELIAAGKLFFQHGQLRVTKDKKAERLESIAESTSLAARVSATELVIKGMNHLGIPFQSDTWTVDGIYINVATSIVNNKSGKRTKFALCVYDQSSYMRDTMFDRVAAWEKLRFKMLTNSGWTVIPIHYRKLAAATSTEEVAELLQQELDVAFEFAKLRGQRN